MINLHCHVIPNTDDGSQSFEESIEIVRGLYDQGFTELVTTPHYIDGSNYDMTKAKNTAALKALRVRLKKEKVKAKVFLGNEIMIDPNIVNYIKRGKVSTLADSKYVLVELPMSGEYDDYEDILFSIHYAGYFVVLAHPERYNSFKKDFKSIERLVDQGILLQCNLGSFIGQYGRHAEKTVKKLAKNNMIFAIGTDTHHVRDWSEIPRALKKMRKYYSEDELKVILETNPRQIIADAK